tara:strand:+ start:324 stop:896 length:573 start_codon:yes stop_codon:yes gene_type:complete
MSKSPINFGMMSGVGGMMSSIMSGVYGNMSDQDLRAQYDRYSGLGPAFQSMGNIQGALQGMQAEIARRQALGNFGMPQATASVSGGPGAAFTDPNNTTTTGNFSINPNAGGRFANAVEATGAPGEPTQFADGSEGYMVNRFGGFRGPTGGGTIPANVATANNFSTDTSKAAAQIFGNSTQFQPRKRLITL